MTTGDESYAGALAKVFDRGSEAGKILYKLYGGAGTTKQAGNEFSKKNLQSFKDRLRDGGSAAPAVTNEIVKPAVPRVAVPRVGRGGRAGPAVDLDNPRAGRAPPSWGGKKGSAQIEEELEALRDEIRADPPPVPKRALLDDKEKDRLSRINEFGKGNVPVNLPPLGYGRNVPRGNLRSKQQRTPLEEFEQRFDEVIEEIAERESHLEEMGQLGGRTDDMATQVRAEIAERVRLLRRLDDRIKEMRAADDGAREGIVGGGGSGGAALPAARER